MIYFQLKGEDYNGTKRFKNRGKFDVCICW